MLYLNTVPIISPRKNTSDHADLHLLTIGSRSHRPRNKLRGIMEGVAYMCKHEQMV